MKEEKKQESKKRTAILEKIEIPEDITVTINTNEITTKGKYGEVKRIIKNPMISLKTEGKEVLISSKGMTKKENMNIKTWKAHIKNMIKGAQEGHFYKLKICSGHFPMNVSLNGNELHIKNFLGEKVPRTVKIRGDVKVAIEGDIVNIESASKELAGQMAADIEQLCIIKNRDSRIFQDGIWIIEKDGKVIK